MRGEDTKLMPAVHIIKFNIAQNKGCIEQASFIEL